MPVRACFLLSPVHNVSLNPAVVFLRSNASAITYREPGETFLNVDSPLRTGIMAQTTWLFSGYPPRADAHDKSCVVPATGGITIRTGSSELASCTAFPRCCRPTRPCAWPATRTASDYPVTALASQLATTHVATPLAHLAPQTIDAIIDM